MHPALSIILFTCLSGAGFGLAVLAAVTVLLAPAAGRSWLSGTTLLMAILLIAVGLSLSVFHLRRPLRARFALSQWRSSWLSREGVLSLFTVIMLGILLLLGWWGDAASQKALLMALAATVLLGAIGSVGATGMIYASLRTIPEWCDHRVVPAYLALSLQSGSLFYLTVSAVLDEKSNWIPIIALCATLAAWAIKLEYWRAIERKGRPTDEAAALGLEGWSNIAPLDPTQTGPNYVTQEMGFRVARKHRAKLQKMALALGCGLPLIGILAILVFELPFPIRAAIAFLVTGAAVAGILIERWLFFAQARHVAMTYY